MRKIWAIGMAMVMLLSVAGCGESKVSTEVPATSESTTQIKAEETSANSAQSTAVTGESSSTDSSVSSTADTTSATVSSTTDSTATVDKTEITTTTKVKTTSQVKTTGKTQTTATTTTTKAPTTTATTAAKVETLEEYLAMRPQKTIVGSSADEKGWIYQLGTNGLMVRETTIDSGKGGEPVEIVQITDVHFSTINAQDRSENNASVMAVSKLGRKGTSRVQMERHLQYANYFDKTIITGDVLDYLSWGNIEMLKSVIWDRYPQVTVSLGNHDSVRTWQFAGYVRDTTSRDSRYAILQENWKHDIYYVSEVINNKVMTITMDNGSTFFHESQVEKLSADLTKARQNGYVVLLFYHIPLATGDENDKAVVPIRSNDGVNGINLSSTACKMTNKSTKAVYNLITNNADIIKGAFCGHEHSDVYSEIHAKTADGQAAVIPQYLLAAAMYDYGHVMKITVK